MRNVLVRAIRSLKDEGLYGTYLKLHALLSDPLFDIKYGTDTSSIIELNKLTIDSKNKEYGVRYQPTKAIFLRKFLHHIQPILPSSGVLIDLGCGNGRVLMIASEYGFRELRGVEFAHELCESAKFNIAVYKNRSKTGAAFKIVESDVTNYPIQPDENVFFMFNPFDEKIMAQVLNNISLSLKVRYREILIIYLNPRCDKLINSFDGIRKIGEYNFGYHFTVYSNSIREEI